MYGIKNSNKASFALFLLPRNEQEAFTFNKIQD